VVYGASDLAGPDGSTCTGRKPERFGPMMSHRFGLLTGPLDETGYCVDSIESLLACHSIRFSRFRRSGEIRYLSAPPLSMTYFDRFSGRSGAYKTPPTLWLEASAWRWSAYVAPVTAIRSPSTRPELSIRAPSPKHSAEAASVIYHRTWVFARDFAHVIALVWIPAPAGRITRTPGDRPQPSMRA
jgi:hypothetical protein